MGLGGVIIKIHSLSQCTLVSSGDCCMEGKSFKHTSCESFVP